MAAPSLTDAPLLTTNWLNEPLLPRNSKPPNCQRALGLTNRTSLDLAVGFRPMAPLPELVRNELLERTSNVNEPFVPTLTSVKVLVTLLNVLVAPSATICPRSDPTAAAHTRRASRRAWI